MDRNNVVIKIRRYDISENPEEIEKIVMLNPELDYQTLKKQLQDICNVNPETKVIKLRNCKGVLIPLSFIVENLEDYYYVDVNNVSYAEYGSSNVSLLQDAYVDAVKHKVKSIESRIYQAEFLLPQLEWRRQSYMEETINGLSSKVGFLNRRFDELLPQFMPKIPETAA
ncbi:unnamed protein product [Brassicogethes aeneus]|uniref:Uncharacterized protein n=1 Tax=Brassicogethes aeneus TaxID=1431903 RepID=A0A9P0FEK2_BRAAE|nr:unnamed protein product [Brassicogethes aeneus]